MRANSTSSRAACSNPTVLPVAIHFQGVSTTDRACLVAVAQSAIASTNKDFSGTNNEISTLWENVASSYYPDITIGETCVEFQIASQNHPTGFGLQDGDLAITINQTNDDFLPQWAGYVNVFVGEIDGLGYSPLGGEGVGDGLAVHKRAFAVDGMSCGDVNSYQNNGLGRTLTHELGHFLFLDHVWGNGGCNRDDGVSDTPNQAEPNFSCPSLGNTRACTSEALHMNHMDYPDDACVYMFTAGQSERMENWVNSVLFRSLKSNVLGAVNEGNPIATETEEEETDNEEEIPTETEEEENTDNEEETPTETEEEETDNEEETPTEIEEENTDSEEETPTETEEENIPTSMIRMEVTLDNYGSETTFAILNGEGEVIKEYGPFEDDQNGRVITASIELPLGIYTFLIEDSYRDGICCEYGRGRWRLFRDGVRIQSSNGRFGSWEAYDFAIGSAKMSGPAHRVDPKGVTPLKSEKIKTFIQY